MLKRSRRITDVANAMLGLRWCIGGQDTSDQGLASA
jgi:hypothetical protein